MNFSLPKLETPKIQPKLFSFEPKKEEKKEEPKKEEKKELKFQFGAPKSEI